MSSTRPVAFVTGGAQGIGWYTCEALSDHGWQVVVADVNEELAAKQAANLENASAIHIDVTQLSSVQAAIAHTVDRFQRLDLCVNNAGIQRHTTIADLDWSDWQAVMDVNLYGVARCLQVAARYMLQAGHGAIVNIASVAAERGAPGRAPYVASKAAVVALTKTAAVEWASRGVRVNAVGPGYVDTPLLQTHIEDGDLDLEPILSRIPMARLANPREVAEVICFLGSDEASYVTGQTLFVDGGFLADYGIPSATATRASETTRNSEKESGEL